MHVGMEKAVAQRLGQKAAHQSQRDLLGIVTGGAQQRRRSRIGMPSIHSLVSTRAEVRRPVHMRHAEFGVAAGALVKLRRRRRFHAQIQFQRHRGRQGLDQRDEAQPPRLRRKALAPRARTGPARPDRGRIASRCRAAALSPPRCRRPSLVVARCTWAMEAAATGAPKQENRLSTGLPKARAISARAAASEKGGSRSCRCSSARATSSPTMSGRVASIWPSLM